MQICSDILLKHCNFIGIFCCQIFCCNFVEISPRFRYLDIEILTIRVLTCGINKRNDDSDGFHDDDDNDKGEDDDR